MGSTPTNSTAANGNPAKDPIRVYAGLETAEDPKSAWTSSSTNSSGPARSRRKVLVVVPTTGTGWVNPTAAQAIELCPQRRHGARRQPVLVPAELDLVPRRPGEGRGARGSKLIDRVHERWLQEPEATRPKLLVYGESLGTQAGEGAFDTLSDIRADRRRRVVGRAAELEPAVGQLIAAPRPRHSRGRPRVLGGSGRCGSPTTPPTWWRKPANGSSPRILYVQHPSDPVVWWSPDLVFTRPDWLKEPPGEDRSPSMKWFPFVTFWQVSADLTNAAGVPDGHGHNYGTLVLDGWITVAQPEGWTPVDTERVRSTLESLSGTEGPEK